MELPSENYPQGDYLAITHRELPRNYLNGITEKGITCKP
jgi:hypothetical protein